MYWGCSSRLFIEQLDPLDVTALSHRFYQWEVNWLLGILAQSHKGHYLIVRGEGTIDLAWPQLTNLQPEGDSEDLFLWEPATVSQVLEGEIPLVR